MSSTIGNEPEAPAGFSESGFFFFPSFFGFFAFGARLLLVSGVRSPFFPSTCAVPDRILSSIAFIVRRVCVGNRLNFKRMHRELGKSAPVAAAAPSAISSLHTHPVRGVFFEKPIDSSYADLLLIVLPINLINCLETR
jgi:hypothetical protein